MTTARFYVSPTASLKGRLTLVGAEHHHISRVLRMRTGQAVQLLDGKGNIGHGILLEITSAHTVVMVEGSCRVQEERPRLCLFQALPQGTKMDSVVQWSVELGAAVVAPFACTRSRVLDSALEKRVDRWRKIALESSRVAGRPFLPEVRKARSWDDALRELAAMKSAIFADEAGGVKPSVVLDGPLPDELGLMIGPEGGFCDEEREELVGSGIRPVTLGSTLLRTETAGLVLLAAVRCHYGML